MFRCVLFAFPVCELCLHLLLLSPLLYPLHFLCLLFLPSSRLIPFWLFFLFCFSLRALNPQYIGVTGRGISTWFVSTSGTDNHGQERFLTWIVNQTATTDS